MEPTDFEKWCAGELGYSPEWVMMQRKINFSGGHEYSHGEIAKRYRAWNAGVCSRLPYQTPPKGDEDEGHDAD
ncbi:TPA: hypothetical protein JD310_002366 [Morganella morganii]|uniref:hypothetical protein n=2 Tax=Morganella morganii TaxID=582 RepID=UPI00056428E7|nr:hypothetical protein [Morganella morganii]OPL23293.1 hypothetical protein B5S45_15620 [Morganella morganii]HAU5616754.1 hypothetical protein [Morganella morganii]HCU2396488.1 hypothetical protein [Morganella morganii]HDQ2581196.1 hypothetical protein [Morganella morganii]